MTYGFDIKGNMTSQSATGVASTYEWTVDNLLKKATVASGDFKLPPQEVHYKYDYAGRRLLKHVGTAGQRTRHFFNGLTEEIKKVSVGTHADTSFAFVTMVDGTSTTGWVQGWGTGASIASVYDADRFSDVLELEPVTRYDFGWGSLRTEKTVSFWFKYGSGGTAFAFPVSTSLGNRRVHLIFTNGTSGYHSGTTEYRVYMGTAMNDGEWHRVEVDFSRIVATQTPGGTFNGTWGVWVYSTLCWIDDMRLSNSMTVEHNTLGGGVIGHILRNRSINVAGIVPTATDRWFHYDQVGSVMATTNASGALSELRHPDAFGNRMASWQSGLWTNTYAERKGWGHNTKEFDADIGLVYMYQRWYNPELGLFGSKAPYPPSMEHQYGFAEQKPSLRVDPQGNFSILPPSLGPPFVHCANATPRSSTSGICDMYCDDDTHKGYSAKCVCENAGDNVWDKFVRGCLSCMYQAGADPDFAHKTCYSLADNKFGNFVGIISRIDIGIRLTPLCFFGMSGTGPEPGPISPVGIGVER